MANKTKGEVEVRATGNTYVLIFDVNALCALEDRLGDSSLANVFEADPEKLRISMLRTVFHCGLRRHHPDVDEAAAGDIMTEVGIITCMEAVARAMTAAFPDSKGPLGKGRSHLRAAG
jgi:hypothetical protein